MSHPRESVLIVDWLASRSPEPPAALVENLRALLGEESCDVADLPSRLISHATRILSDPRDERSYAAELLVADALVSYAIEAAADQCRDVESFALEAAAGIAGILR